MRFKLRIAVGRDLLTFTNSTIMRYHSSMKGKHQKTLLLLFSHPTSANVDWNDVVGLLRSLGAVIEERKGSRVGILLNDKTVIFHRPHPRPSMDKGAVVSMREFLNLCGITPEGEAK
ncbi:MAG: type II toxin-antitoxin system HicA family toxin [Nitrospirae bacterium]|nr:type II toxin-antitoxin system HicA family toxin [Nitrospirota bacterium]